MTDYQPGQRVVLVHTSDPYTRLQPGDTGTVRGYDTGLQTVYVAWDDGSTLAMCLDAGDRIHLQPATETPTPATGPTTPAAASGRKRWAAALARCRAAGADAGRTAADRWAQDTVGGRARGDTRAAARRILTGIDDGDPVILDTLPTVTLSGPDTHAAAGLFTDVAGGTGLSWARLSNSHRDAAIGAYQDAFDTAVAERVGEVCRAAASPTGRDLTHLHPRLIRIGRAGVFAGDWARDDSDDGDRIAVGFAGVLVDRWNGWAVFSCTRTVADAIVADQQQLREQTRADLREAGMTATAAADAVDIELADLRFDGDIIIADQRALTGDPTAVAQFPPDTDGRYVVMGRTWTWDAVDPYDCDRIVGDLPEPGDEQQFEILTHTPAIHVPPTARLQLGDVIPAGADGDGLITDFSAVLTLDDEPVAAVDLHAGSVITIDPPDAMTIHPGLRAYTGASRYHGRPVDPARLLEAITGEYLFEQAIETADATGRTLLRVVDDGGRVHAVRMQTPIPTSLGDLLDLGRTLTRPAGRRWEIWTGAAWFTIPGPRTTPDPDRLP